MAVLERGAHLRQAELELSQAASIAAAVLWASPLAGTKESEKLWFAEHKVKCKLKAGSSVGWG